MSDNRRPLDQVKYTKAGRDLMKHVYGDCIIFPKPIGTPSEINRQGESILAEILHNPKRVILKNNRGGIEIYSSNGKGSYFREDGTFRGFIEYGYK